MKDRSDLSPSESNDATDLQAPARAPGKGSGRTSHRGRTPGKGNAAARHYAGMTVQAKKGQTSVSNGPDPAAMQSKMKESAGQALESSTAASMGASLQADFSNVSVHTDAAAQQLCADTGSKAMTSGSHIYFGAGNYSPGTDGGRELLGHELTHVVQQSEGRASGLAAKAEDDTSGSRDGLEAEADHRGKKAAKDAKEHKAQAPGAAINWGAVDAGKLKQHLDQLDDAGAEVPVAHDKAALKDNPLLASLAQKFQAPAATAAGAQAPAQADKDENWWGLGWRYNMVEVTGIPAKFLEHGDYSTATYNFHAHGHTNWSTRGANSRRDGNFGIVISGGGGSTTYHYDDAKRPEWSKSVQKKVGGASDRKKVSMHNWAFSNIEASDWFDVVPGVLGVTPGAEYVIHGVGDKLPFAMPAHSSVEVGYSQVVSHTSGITTDQSLGSSTTRTREISLGLKAGLEKKDVYKVGAEGGLSSSNYDTVWSKVSNSVGQVHEKGASAGQTVKLEADDEAKNYSVYPVWSVLPIHVKAYPHDSENKVTGGPTTFTLNHMKLMQLKAMPTTAEGKMQPGAPNDKGAEAEAERLKKAKAGEGMQVGGNRVTVALESERQMVKDYDNQKPPLAIYNKDGYHQEQSWSSAVKNSFVQTDSSGQETGGTSKWELGVGGEYMGLGGSFGYGEAKTAARNFGDSVARSGGQGAGSSLTVKVNVKGPDDPKKTYVQLSLIPMYTERVYKYALFNPTTGKWTSWLPNRTRSREYSVVPAMERIVRPKGTDLAPVGAPKLEPSAAQKKSAKTIKELKKRRDEETDPAKKQALAEQIEGKLRAVQEDQEKMVRGVHSTLQAVDRDNNLYKITVNGKDYFGTLEVLADFTPPSEATQKAGNRLYSKGGTDADGTSVEVAGGLGGTGAQGRVNPHPGDIDLSEQIKVTAKTADAASAALARMIQQTVRDATSPNDSGLPPMQFLRMTCGLYPADSTKAGKILGWTASQVLAGQQTYRTKDHKSATVTLAEAFANPNPDRVCNTFWRGPIDSKGTFGEITKVMAYEAIDADTGKKMFGTNKIGQAYQEVSFDKPVAHDTKRMTLMDALSPQIAAYAKEGNWLKAVKRAYTVARMSGDFEACNDFDAFLGGNMAELKTVTEHTELFMDEVVNNKKSQPKATPDVKEVVSREDALAQAHQLESRITLLDAAIGRHMTNAIEHAGHDVRRNRSMYHYLKGHVVAPLKAKIGHDHDFAAKAKASLMFHGYLKAGDLR